MALWMVLRTLALAMPARPAVHRLASTARQLRISCPPIACASTSAAPSAEPQETLLVQAWLCGRVQAALGDAFGSDFSDADPLVTPATKIEFGDYQCNAAMSLAKKVQKKPRDVAEAIVEAISPMLGEIMEPPEIAGPGFLNFRLTPQFVASQLDVMRADPKRSGVPRSEPSQRVVVDYSSPNIAKEMHVGHLRSSIIGDALARVLELRGHDVLRLNHVGDWGTQFGMLITHMKEVAPRALEGEGEESVGLEDLVGFYKAAKARFDSEDAFKTASREEVVRLQAGDEASLAAWRMLCKQSEVAFSEVYRTLALDERLIMRGESFYNTMLSSTVAALDDVGLLKESGGAQCVFLDGYTNRDGEPLPMIVKKSDGGFMYSTTDLAAIRQRCADEHADRVLYVTDSGQSLHFQQVFEIARQASLAPSAVSLEHVPFGLVLGEDGKKFKTRSGDTVKLVSLLDEALARARSDIESRLETEGRDESDDFVAEVSRAVGIGAVKYADLAMNRNSNYKFSYDKMLSLQGNTAPYMLYAYARIRGIERRAAERLGDDFEYSTATLSLEAPAELNLARHLLRFSETVLEVERSLLPSQLCEYIFELAGKFNQFYESCPVLAAETPDELKASRLALCGLTASVLKQTLTLLGITPLERL